MKTMRTGAAAWIVLLSCSAPMRVLTPSERAVQTWGFEVQRASVQQLELAAKEVLELAEEYPMHREVLELTLRTQLAYGELAPTVDRVGIFAEAKEIGRECLRLNGAWKVMEGLSGGRITAPALRRLEASDLGCLRMLVANWVRWIEHKGHSSTVDLPMLALLSERTMELAATIEALHWRDHWAVGMTIGLSRPTEASMADADFHFRRAQELEPSVATASIDRIQAWARIGVNNQTLHEELLALGKANFPIHDNALYGAQNRQALKRAIELLAQLRTASE